MSMITTMAQKYLDNPDSIPAEYMQEAYEFVEEYCQKNNLDLVDFVKDTSNAPRISEAIHGALGWLVRKAIKKDDIQTTIENNHTWIVNKFTELHNAKFNITPETVEPKERKTTKETQESVPKKAAAKKTAKAKEEKTPEPAKKTAKPKK